MSTNSKTEEEKKLERAQALAILQATVLSEHAIQRYLAHILDRDEKEMWPLGITPIHSRDFQTKTQLWKVTLDLVPSNWMVDITPIDSKVARDGMSNMASGACAVWANICGVLTPEMDPTGILNNSRLVMDQSNSTLVAYCPSCPVKIRDKPMRIGFRITPANTEKGSGQSPAPGQ